MSTVVSPHDHFFKECFSRPKAAADLFRRALPAEVVNALDLTTIRTAKGSFVDPKLREHHTDLLFEVTGRDGSPVLVYLLAEHKSSPDRWVVLDLLRYASEIWREWVKQNSGKWIMGMKLPPLIPLVLYHGKDSWTIPTDIADLVDIPAILERYRPHFCYELLDLSDVADGTLPAGVESRAALLTLKYIFHPEKMQEWLLNVIKTVNELNEVPGRLELMRIILNYMAVVHDLEDKWLRQVLNENFLEGDSIMPTMAERWEQRGLRRGEGLVVDRLLQRRFGPLPEWATNRLENAEPEELEQCADRLLDAPSLEAVFQVEGRH
ncbi:transposase [Gammaproteobacteria bacterium]